VLDGNLREIVEKLVLHFQAQALENQASLS
jgi:hypothetical protein